MLRLDLRDANSTSLKKSKKRSRCDPFEVTHLLEALELLGPCRELDFLETWGLRSIDIDMSLVRCAWCASEPCVSTESRPIARLQTSGSVGQWRGMAFELPEETLESI